MPHLKINRKLEQFLTKSKSIKVAIGGRGSGKSIGFGDALTMKMDTEAADIYCLREFQDSVADSVHRVFKDSIQKRLELNGWGIYENKVVAPNGAKTTYKGANRNPDSMQSAQGFKYSWFEEAHRASKSSLDKLLPTIIRTPGAECWFSGNPQSSGDAFSQRFIVPYQESLDRYGYYEDDIHLIVKLNWRDNPWWNEEQEQLRQWDYDNRPRSEYDWIWEGAFNDYVPNAIIMADWFDAAIDAHTKLGFKPQGILVTAHDPSDEGADDKSTVIRHGSVIVHAEEMDTGDSCEGMDRALDISIFNQSDLFVWDAVGLGLSLKRQVKDSLEGKKTQWRMFIGGETVDRPDDLYEEEDYISKYERVGKARTNRETFKNKRAQYYWELRNRFYNTWLAVVKGKYIDPDRMISISSTIPCLQKMRTEVCRIPKKHTGNGFIQIKSKDDIKKELGNSPNIADALMMSMCANEFDLISVDYDDMGRYNHYDSRVGRNKAGGY